MNLSEDRKSLSLSTLETGMLKRPVIDFNLARKSHFPSQDFQLAN